MIARIHHSKSRLCSCQSYQAQPPYHSWHRLHQHALTVVSQGPGSAPRWHSQCLRMSGQMTNCLHRSFPGGNKKHSRVQQDDYTIASNLDESEAPATYSTGNVWMEMWKDKFSDSIFTVSKATEGCMLRAHIGHHIGRCQSSATSIFQPPPSCRTTTSSQHARPSGILRDPALSADNFQKKLKMHLFWNALGHLAH